jgi:hypothetical protein
MLRGWRPGTPQSPEFGERPPPNAAAATAFIAAISPCGRLATQPPHAECRLAMRPSAGQRPRGQLPVWPSRRAATGLRRTAVRRATPCTACARPVAMHPPRRRLAAWPCGRAAVQSDESPFRRAAQPPRAKLGIHSRGRSLAVQSPSRRADVSTCGSLTAARQSRRENLARDLPRMLPGSGRAAISQCGRLAAQPPPACCAVVRPCCHAVRREPISPCGRHAAQPPACAARLSRCEPQAVHSPCSCAAAARLCGCAAERL